MFYHFGPALDGLICAALPGWTIGAETYGESDTDYKLTTNGGKVTPAREAFAALAQVAIVVEDAATTGKGSGTMLGGFSRGCQGVRAQLAAGFVPSAAIAADGTHANNPPTESNTTPWRAFANLAKAGGPLLGISATSIDIPGRAYLATREVLPLITGWADPDGPGALAAAGWTLAGNDQAGRPVYRRLEGNLVAYQFQGKDAAAHVEQARVTLPGFAQVFGRAIEAREGLAGGPLQVPAGSLPPGPSPQSPPGGGTPTRPPTEITVPPIVIEASPPEKPAPDSDSSGAAVVGGLFLLGLGVAVARARK
jgi:hypothetical protein